ncbi:MAG: hypothetical protein ACK2UO_07800 [Caldilineaceae bacterium]|jgi:hypothetical protein
MANLVRYPAGYPQIVFYIALVEKCRRHEGALITFLVKSQMTRSPVTQTKPTNADAVTNNTPHRALASRAVDSGASRLAEP